MRGVGHKNFVQCIKFDKFFQINHLKYLQKQFDSELAEEGNVNDRREEEKKEINSLNQRIKKTVNKGTLHNQLKEGLSDFDDTEMKFEASMRKVSQGGAESARGNTKSILLNKLQTQKKIQENFDQREYRLVTGSDDGYLLFWNIPYDMVTETKNLFHSDLKKQSTMKGKRSHKKIPEFKPKYELYLSAYANI